MHENEASASWALRAVRRAGAPGRRAWQRAVGRAWGAVAGAARGGRRAGEAAPVS